MHDVAAEDGFPAAGADMDDDMAGRVAWCRHEADSVLDLVFAVDQNGLAGREDRQYAVDDVVAGSGQFIDTYSCSPSKRNRNAFLSVSMKPAVGVGKWDGTISTSVSE